MINPINIRIFADAKSHDISVMLIFVIAFVATVNSSAISAVILNQIRHNIFRCYLLI